MRKLTRDEFMSRFAHACGYASREDVGTARMRQVLSESELPVPPRKASDTKDEDVRQNPIYNGVVTIAKHDPAPIKVLALAETAWAHYRSLSARERQLPPPVGGDPNEG